MASITENEYGKWLSPSLAVEALRQHGFDSETAREAILFKIALGDLLAVAGWMELRAAGHDKANRKCEMMPFGTWATGKEVTEAFWTKSEVTFLHGQTESGAIITRICSGVRLEPSGIKAIGRRLLTPASPAPRTEAKDEWLSARAAVAMLERAGQHHRDAKVALVRDAAAELLAVWCRRMIIREVDSYGTPIAGGSKHVEDNCQVGGAFWDAIEVNDLRSGGDWFNGYFEALIGPELSREYVQVHGVRFRHDQVLAMQGVEPEPYGHDGVGTISAEDVERAKAAWESRKTARRSGRDPNATTVDKLSAFAREALTAAPSPPPAPVRKRSKRGPAGPVDHEEFNRWFTALPVADQAKGYRWIWDAATTHFRPRRVLKKWAEEIAKGRKTGRKTKG
jgi:hypothetical protein